MLCNCICILTGLYDKIHKNHKETEHNQSCKVTLDLSIAVKVTIIFASPWIIELH